MLVAIRSCAMSAYFQGFPPQVAAWATAQAAGNGVDVAVHDLVEPRCGFG
jgi:hypothetical protein